MAFFLDYKFLTLHKSKLKPINLHQQSTLAHWKNETPLGGLYIMPDLVEVCGKVWKCMLNKLKYALSLPYI
jgi:hypothetical protein